MRVQRILTRCARGFGLSAVGLTAIACNDGQVAFVQDEPFCEHGDPMTEQHGTDCSCCHDEFGLSGSVDLSRRVSHVLIRDGSGLSFEVAVNPYANFFRHVELSQPVQAGVRLVDGSVTMMQGPAHGACNSCHRASAELGLLGGQRTPDSE